MNKTDNDIGEPASPAGKAVEALGREGPAIFPASTGGRLGEFLGREGFYLPPTIVSLVEAKMASTRKAFLVRGPAGVGKTTLAELLAKWWGAEVVFYQATIGTGEDELLFKYVPSETSRSGVEITLGPVPLALKLSKRRRVVLVIDEFDKTRPSTDALLLDVLQNFRVALHISDKERVIEGNPENIMIFLTSNDVREFSEPLLRRTLQIFMRPLPVERVHEILVKKFDDKIALLLTQIYDDTIRAGLRKPATIQELQELGELLQGGVDIPLEELLRSIVVKYDDDWAKYVDYIRSRHPYQFAAGVEEKTTDAVDISNAYTAPEGEVSLPAPVEASTAGAQEVIHSLERLVVKAPPTPQIAPEEAQEGEEVTMKVPNNDFTAYTELIQKMKIEPEDTPDILGKFKVVLDGVEMKIISKTPPTIKEAIIVSKLDNYEVFVEDYVVLNGHFTDVSFVGTALAKGARIVYYTRKTKIVQKDNDIIIRLDLLGDAGALGGVYRIQMYLRKTEASSWILEGAQRYTPPAVIAAVVGDLRDFRDFKDGALFLKRWGGPEYPEQRHVALLRGLMKVAKILPIQFNIVHKNNIDDDVRVTAEGMAVTLEVKEGVPIDSIDEYARALERGAEVSSE